MQAVSELLSLGYIGVGADALDDWRGFGTRLLGMQCIDATARSLAFRMDERRQRLFVEAGRAAPVYGWETADAASLDRLASRLEAAGVAVERQSGALADQRLVAGLIAFRDPLGTPLEAFHGPMVTAEPFRPGRAISGFRTGPLGMGHVVLTVPCMDDALPFYRDILGFRLSDWTERPFRACFMHVNPRHHSLALIETGRAGMHHLMVELFSMDDVGQGYDLAQGEKGRVATTLGRHTNDHMLSFYARTPSGFMVEYGWGGRDIDPESWQPVECRDGPSLWGHDRDWLPPERQLEARAIRLAAAAKGERAPVHVIPGNHDLLAGACPWWSASVANAAASTTTRTKSTAWSRTGSPKDSARRDHPRHG